MRRSQSPGPVLSLTICLLLPVLKADGIQMRPEVRGYVGQIEVILPCEFVPGPDGGVVTQVQWDLKATNSLEEDKMLVVHAVSSESTFITEGYKDKLGLNKYSLVIKNVNLEDAGVYACRLATYPGGAHEGVTSLLISDQMPLSAGAVSAIVISVLLLLGISAASVYFIVLRRCPPSSRNHVTVDTADWDPSRPSFIKRDDVVYADVSALQTNSQRHMTSSEDHVTYSDVRVDRTRPDHMIYARVVKM